MRWLLYTAPAVVIPLLLVWLAGLFFFRWSDRLIPAEQRSAFLAAGERLLTAAQGAALVVAAHPDDIEYWLGGTLPRLVRAGVPVDVVLATRGEKGGTQPDLARIRTTEQERAGAILAYRRIIWLDLPDRGVTLTPALVARLLQIYDEVRPGLVFTFDAAKPLPPYRHPDHQAIGLAATAAFEAWSARHAGARLCLFHTRRPNALVDIRSTAALKQAAFAAHESQHGPPKAALRVAFALLRLLFPHKSIRGTGFDEVEALYCPVGSSSAAVKR